MLDSISSLLSSFAGFIVPVVVLGMVLLVFSLQSRRGGALQRIVADRRWNWHDDEIPDDTPYRELLRIPRRTIRIYNGFSGTSRGVSFVCADYRIGWGRQSRTITLLAVRSDQVPPQHLRSDFRITSTPEWYGVTKTVLWIATTMTPETLLSAIDEIA